MNASMCLDKFGIDAISRTRFGRNTHRFYLKTIFSDETVDDKVWPWPTINKTERKCLLVRENQKMDGN